jgi:hypothetical protein
MLGLAVSIPDALLIERFGRWQPPTQIGAAFNASDVRNEAGIKCRKKPHSDKTGGLNGSTQHLPKNLL